MSTPSQSWATPPPSYATHGPAPGAMALMTDAQLSTIWNYVASRPAETFDRESLEMEGYISKFYEYDGELERLHCHRETPQVVKDFLNVNENLRILPNAEQIVKNRWTNAGLWNEEWDRIGRFDKWPHEDDHRFNASRPCQAFFLAVETKYQWHVATKGEFLPFPHCLSYPSPHQNFLFHAHQSVKKTWDDLRIWNPQWGSTPGERWQHEEYSSIDWAPLDKRLSGLPRDP